MDQGRAESLAQDLPQELLGEIFVLCLPENHFDYLLPNAKGPPLVLCHVCRSWRNAAFGTPHLWSELSMEFDCGSPRSLRSGILRNRCDMAMLEFWLSHMSGLLPSFHFRNRGMGVISPEPSMVIPFQTFFGSPAISKARSLTLDGFFTNVLKKSFPLNISFNNLEFLAIRQPQDREGHTPAALFSPTPPTLRRLHIDYSQDNPERFVTGYSWRTITHLSAHFRFGTKQDFLSIFSQCTNLTSCSVTLSFFWFTENHLPVTFHHNLRTLSVQGAIEVFSGFVFPSLVALRISCTYAKLENIHQMLTATPGLKELHLHSLEYSLLLLQPQGSDLAGPLSRFVPGLMILVIDRISYSRITTGTNEDILTLLHSSWLNGHWPTLSDSQMSVEFIFNKPDGPLLVDDLNRKIGRCGSLPFHASARYVPGGLWRRKSLNARELRDYWDDILAFRYR